MPSKSAGRPVREAHERLTLKMLRERGYFQEGKWMRGTETWRCPWGSSTSVRVEVGTQEDWAQVVLHYQHRGQQQREVIETVTTPSNLGRGRVRYFVCPMTGHNCRTLYWYGGRWGSRHACPEALYVCQTRSKLARQVVADPGPWPTSRPCYYAGEPTKGYQQFMRRLTARREFIVNMAARLGIPVDWREDL